MQTERFASKIDDPEVKSFFLFSIISKKVVPYLLLGNVEAAKSTMAHFKELADEVSKNADEKKKNDVKWTLYRCHYEYYSRSGDTKKAIQSFTNWFNHAWMSRDFTPEYLYSQLYDTSKFCVENKAFRQGAYLHEVAKDMYKDMSMVLENLEVKKIKSLLLEASSIFIFLSELKALEEMTSKSDPNIFNYCVPFNIELLQINPNDPKLNRSFNKSAESLRKMFFQAKKMMYDIAEMLKNFPRMEFEEGVSTELFKTRFEGFQENVVMPIQDLYGFPDEE